MTTLRTLRTLYAAAAILASCAATPVLMWGAVQAGGWLASGSPGLIADAEASQ